MFYNLLKIYKSDEMDLKIGYEFNTSIEDLDPANIIDIYQSNLIENLYSRIIEYDANDQLVCVLCTSFWVDKDKLIFEFRNDLLSSRGIKISAIDAKFSLERLIKLNTNTHGNLNNFIDINNNKTIAVEENKLIITLRENHYSQFLIPLFASMDFSIIPSSSVENHAGEMRLDLKNTSGPYFLDSIDSEGNFILKSNNGSPLFSTEMFKELKIVKIRYGEGIDSFLEGKIDLLDITYYPGLPQYEKLFEQKSKNFSSHKTILMNMLLLSFTPKAVSSFTQDQLFYAAKIIENMYLAFKRYGYGLEKSIEFFQSNGAGLFNQNQIAVIKSLRDKLSKPKFEKKIIFGVQDDAFERVTNALRNHSEILVKSYDEYPGALPLNDRPDIFMIVTDSSFNEDISLLGYNISQEIFGFSKADGDKWLNEFINIPKKEERVLKLQRFQFEILQKPFIYPIGVSPYWAIANDDLELNFPKSFPGSSWWKVRKK